MRAHKFLGAGAFGPLTGFAWPTPHAGAPGAWVEAEGPLLRCQRGTHVCRPLDLAHWLHDELWELEADGDHVDGLDCLVVRRARLVRRIDAWSDGKQRFADACVDHAAAQAGSDPIDPVAGLLDDARFMAAHGYVALSAFTAALALSRVGAAATDAYRRERAWQSGWIATELLALPRS